MNANNPDPLMAANDKLRQCLAANFQGNENEWTKCVHDALAKVAAAIQVEVGGSEQELQLVGEINPDFKSPVAERHVEATRERMIQLGERVHQLRAEIRQAEDRLPLDLIHVRLRGEELVNALNEVRKADNEFLLDASTSNPGAGD